MVSQIKRALGACLFLFCGAAFADATRTVHVAPEVDVPVQVYGASTKLILWLPGETGVVSADARVAAQLAQQGYEVWLADLFGARFLPVLPSSIAQIPDSDVTALLRSAVPGHAQIYVLSTGHGAGVALRGARAWQRSGGQKLAGAILLFPNLYANAPEAGEAPRYLDAAKHSRLPIAIVQGTLSPWYWHVSEMQQTLRRGGSRVWVKILPDMRDRFYFRDDASPAERAQGNQLPALILESIEHLGSGLAQREKSSMKKRNTP